MTILLYNVLIMKLPEIIGIAGTNGSGKDTLATVRSELGKCLQVTVSDILRQQLRLDGIPLERKNLSELSRQWRDESGDHGILVTRTINQYMGEKALLGYRGLSVVSLRHPAEAQRVQEHNGIVAWIDGDPFKRYSRISQSQRDRTEDNKTFAEFLAEEEEDMGGGKNADPASVNMRAVRDIADLVIINDYDTKDEYVDFLVNRFELE
jgi:cytidylate kinase